MLNFNTIEDLVSHMFESTDNEDNLVSVIADKEMSVEIMKELLDYENVILNSCEIDFDEEYDREYIVSLFDDIESDKWYVNVEKSYRSDKENYISTGGYVLFHGDVNSKAIIDMQNNEYVPLGEYSLFVIGEEECDDAAVAKDAKDKGTIGSGLTDTDADADSEHISNFSVSIKAYVDTNEAKKIFEGIRNDLTNEMVGMIDMMYRFYPRPMRFFW